LQSGKVRWAERSLGKGSLMAADGKLIVLGEKGQLVVADASASGFKPLARAQVIGGKCWTSPVLANGKIYCRNSTGDLVCVDVSGKTD
jgi:outer membrane protein assembly factor BamB